MPNELAKKMAKVLAKVNTIPQTGFNKFQNYAYTTEGDVLNVIRPLLAEQGVAVFFECT